MSEVILYSPQVRREDFSIHSSKCFLNWLLRKPDYQMFPGLTGKNLPRFIQYSPEQSKTMILNSGGIRIFSGLKIISLRRLRIWMWNCWNSLNNYFMTRLWKSHIWITPGANQGWNYNISSTALKELNILITKTLLLNPFGVCDKTVRLLPPGWHRGLFIFCHIRGNKKIKVISPT